MSESVAVRQPRKRSARGMFCSVVLVCEVLVVFFAALVAFGLRSPGTSAGPIWAVAGGAALLCLVAAGLVRHRVGLWLGSVIQVLLIASGVLVTTMYVVGAIFAALWIVALLLGTRIDRERAQRAAVEDRLAAGRLDP